MPNGTYGGVRGGVKTPPTRFVLNTSVECPCAKSGIYASYCLFIIIDSNFFVCSMHSVVKE